MVQVSSRRTPCGARWSGARWWCTTQPGCRRTGSPQPGTIRPLRPAAAASSQVLRIFADRRRLPALIHCAHGKDRTGVVIMLLMQLAGLTPDEPGGGRLRAERGRAQDVQVGGGAGGFRVGGRSPGPLRGGKLGAADL